MNNLIRVYLDNIAEGGPCKVVDVVMNSKIVEVALTNADVFGFMGQIIEGYLLEKHKIKVRPQGTAIPIEEMIKLNLAYKGNAIEPQRIRAKKTPKIEEVS